MTEADTFLDLLRRGPVTHREAVELVGPWMLPQVKRELAAQGNLITSSDDANGRTYRLVKDMDRELRLWLGGAT